MTSLQFSAALIGTLRSVAAGVVIFASVFTSATAQAIKPGDIAPFEVVYQVGNNLISAGTARLSLTNNGELWHYQLKTNPKGILKLAGKGNIDEQSIFRIIETDDKATLQPISYRYRQDNERRRAVDASFDWESKTLTHRYRGKDTTEPLSSSTVDRLTVTVFIMNALRNGLDSTEISVFDNGKIKHIEFINTGMEVMSTPLGEIETYRVVNQQVGGSSRQTHTWFAPSLDYLPVKIEQLKRGELVARLSLLTLENRVTSLELGSALPVAETAEEIGFPLLEIEPEMGASTRTNNDASE